MAVYLRIDGLDIEDFLDAESDHDESTAHDLSDRVFGHIKDDYPRLYDDLEGVIPVIRPEYDPRLLEATAVYGHRDETADDGVSDFVFCSFDDDAATSLDSPGPFPTQEWVEGQLRNRLDPDYRDDFGMLPSEAERDAAGDDPVRVGTLYHDGTRVVRVYFDHLDDVDGDRDE